MCIRAPPPVGDLQAQEQSGSGDVDSLWTDHSRSRCTTFCWSKVKKMVVGRVDVATPEGKPVPSSSGVESELAIAEDGVLFGDWCYLRPGSLRGTEAMPAPMLDGSQEGRSRGVFVSSLCSSVAALAGGARQRSHASGVERNGLQGRKRAQVSLSSLCVQGLLSL